MRSGKSSCSNTGIQAIIHGRGINRSRPNLGVRAMNFYLFKGTRKGLLIAIAAVAVGFGAGVAVLWTTGDVKADSGLSHGFIKGANPAKHETKMIEDGKK